jgi:hypothetical protein
MARIRTTLLVTADLLDSNTLCAARQVRLWPHIAWAAALALKYNALQYNSYRGALWELALLKQPYHACREKIDAL